VLVVVVVVVVVVLVDCDIVLGDWLGCVWCGVLVAG
jgi:hypothetical protein